MIGGRSADWGADWGTVGEIPPDARAAASDSAAADLVAEARRAGRSIPPTVLTGGDLARTLGVTAAAAGAAPSVGRSPLAVPSAAGGAGAQPGADGARTTGTRVAVDVGAVLIDGLLHWFVAHLVARRSWWRGRLLIVANASFVGRWNVAPRAHPGDGRLDTFDAHPSPAVRLAARRRLPSGTHVPHPAIVQRRTAAAQYDLAPDLDVYLDGRRIARASSLSVRVEPAALEVWIPRDR